MKITFSAKNKKVNRYFHEKYSSDNCDDLNIEDIEAFKCELASAIIDEYEKPLISKIINTQYSYYGQEEIKEIDKRIRENLDGTESIALQRREIIENELDKYFSEYDKINLEGFVNFRLGDYIDELVDIISISVEEYIIAEEYEEFLSMMKSYLALQKTKYSKMEVVLYHNNFKLYNSKHTDITEQAIKCCFGNELDMFFRIEDLLLNLLIICAPKELIVHNVNSNIEKEFLNTLKAIFGERMKLCDGCKLCTRDIQIK